MSRDPAEAGRLRQHALPTRIGLACRRKCLCQHASVVGQSVCIIQELKACIDARYLRHTGTRYTARGSGGFSYGVASGARGSFRDPTNRQRVSSSDTDSFGCSFRLAHSERYLEAMDAASSTFVPYARRAHANNA